MKIRAVIYILLVLQVGFMSTIYAQNPDRTFRDYSWDESSLTLVVSDGTLRLVPYSEDIIEVSFYNNDRPLIDSSHAVIMEPKQVEVMVREETDKLIYTAGNFTVDITYYPFQLNYTYHGSSILSENAGFFDSDTLAGFKFNLKKNEVLMGAGERSLGMNRRGHRLELYNKPSYGYQTYAPLMYYCMPLIISSENYMLLWDNAPKGFLDLGATNKDVLSVESTAGRMSYFLIAAPTAKDLVVNYTALTGRQNMAPRWALGNFASRFGYHSEKEAREVIGKYKEDQIPVDGIVFDIYWFGKEIQGHMGTLDWDRNAFPTAEKMMSDFYQSGVNTVLITEPFILTTSKRWDDAKEKGVLCLDSTGNPFTYNFYFGETGLIDIFKPEAKDWMWEIYKEHTDSGVNAWWVDLTEPEYHPSEINHINGSADEVHNIYGHYWAKMMYDGYREDFPNERPFSLMRAGFAGSQHYAMIPWSGDVSRSWGGFKPQPEISLQMALQGMGYMHSDLGGFAGDYKNSELYVRWLQYGVFQPVFRPHAQEALASEPIFWDDETKALAKKAVELRYQMLPYNYHLAFENSQTGLPFMRPLTFAEPENKDLVDDVRSFFWGDNMLVAPVLDSGAASVTFYMPKGNWVDFYTGEVLSGGKDVEKAVTIDNIPVFVKAGSFIPMAPLTQHSKDYSSSELIVHYFDHEDVNSTNASMFNDDGSTFGSYAKGQYEMLNFGYYRQEEASVFKFERTEGDYEGRPEVRDITLILHGKTKPSKVSMGDIKLKMPKKGSEANKDGLSASWDEATNITRIKFTWSGLESDLIIE